MVYLTLLDYAVISLSLVICFAPAFYFARRSGKSTTEYFASGRMVPWWLAGLSMVATTFSSDTPNLVTDIVRQKGVAGNWVWWAFTLTGVATVFFYARLWRRLGVMTDLEFYEMRYSGVPAQVVRGFRAVYLGLVFNCLILATVNLAACKIANILFGLPSWQTLLAVGVLNVVFAAQSGLWGVLVIDMIQFFVKMAAVIAAAYFALIQPQVGGLSGLVEKLSAPEATQSIRYLDVLPDFTNHWDLAVAIFILPLAVQWWSVWYPGAEPGGGSYIAQRMLASKSERDSLGGVLFFNVAHYVLRPWPWILVALCSILVYPTLESLQASFPHVDKSLIGHDSAYPAMLHFMPAGWIGLMVGGLIAANSSTNLTHLNWGASYLIHDGYRRFLRPGASEAHYVLMGRLATVLLFACSAALTYFLASAKQGFDVIVQIGAGTGLLYLVRWFWWRVNAWCEIVAMISSFLISMFWLLLQNAYFSKPEDQFAGLDAVKMISTVAFTTICWLLTAFLTQPTARNVLHQFYRRVRPAGPGWALIRREVEEIDGRGEPSQDNIPLAFAGWIAGVATIWSALFAVGNLLYGRWLYMGEMLAIFVVSGTALVLVVRRVFAGVK